MIYIRLIEVYDPLKLDMILLALSGEGIRFRTLFEQTLRIAGILVLGANGSIIEVAEPDLERAKLVLADIGIELDYDIKKDRFHFINRFDNLTLNVPLLNRLSLVSRFALVTLAPLVIITFLALFFSIQVSESDLIGKHWCVERIIHKGKEIIPNTKSLFVTTPNSKCSEDFYMIETGSIWLPGIETTKVKAYWYRNLDNTITITQLNHLSEIYSGDYIVNTRWNGTIELVSDKTSIRLSRKY